MRWRVRWVILWSLWAGRVVRQPTEPVHVSNGWVRGSVANSGTHKEYLGIPYATVVKRFQAPGPEPTWDATFEAINENIRCTQLIEQEAKSTVGQEDCLILNVYTPLNVPPDELLPVMFFIHGGAFIQFSGSRIIYGPEYLVTKGVILVTINYRLNIQGFGCLRTKEAPGNAGFKDQVAALKWVQRNIKAFGGDPDNVTIFGESSGAASVSFHVLSSLSKGIFHKAIAQSGSSLSAWAFQYKPVYLASLLAKVMGVDSSDPEVIYKHFMTKTDSDLVVTRVPRQEGNTVISEILYAACVEKEIAGEEAFLTELPYDILTKGHYNKVPMIIGANSQEGLLFGNIEKEHFLQNMAMDKVLPKDLTFPSNETKKAVANKLKELYLDNENISLKNRVKLFKMYGEAYFNYPVAQEIEMLVKTSDQPIFAYNFAYDGLRNIIKHFLSSDLKKVRGATHADDIFYAFKQPFIPDFFEIDMVTKITTMWTNFAKYGNPTPAESKVLQVRWPAATTEALNALVIDNNLSIIMPLWHSDTLRYWKHVYSLYRRK